MGGGVINEVPHFGNVHSSTVVVAEDQWCCSRWSHHPYSSAECITRIVNR